MIEFALFSGESRIFYSSRRILDRLEIYSLGEKGTSKVNFDVVLLHFFMLFRFVIINSQIFFLTIPELLYKFVSMEFLYKLQV